MRAPSRSIQHSSTPGLNPGKLAEDFSRSAVSTVNSSLFPDNFFPTARFYLNEHRLCSLHLGSCGSPFFLRHPERSRWIAKRAIGAVEGSLLPDVVASAAKPFARRFLVGRTHANPHAAAFRFFLSSFFSTRIPLSTCFSSSKNGGKNRTTVSCVLLNRTPSTSASSTIGRAGISRLIP